MTNSRNKQIISHSLTALVTFIISAFIFSATDLNLFGSSTSEPTGPGGLIVLQDGSAASRVLVEAYAPDGSVALEVANRQGKFTIKDFMNGNYVLAISTLRDDFGYIGSVPLSESTVDLSFILNQTGSVVGEVSGCNASCVVNITFDNVPIVVQNTQADGTFAISGLAEGTYQIVVYSADSSTTSQELIITATQQALVSLALN